MTLELKKAQFLLHMNSLTESIGSCYSQPLRVKADKEKQKRGENPQTLQLALQFQGEPMHSFHTEMATGVSAEIHGKESLNVI